MRCGGGGGGALASWGNTVIRGWGTDEWHHAVDVVFDGGLSPDGVQLERMCMHMYE